MLRQRATPDPLTLRRLAAQAGVDERSLKKRLRGEKVRGLAGARCDIALRSAGFEPGQERPE